MMVHAYVISLHINLNFKPLKIEIVKVLEGAALRPKNMKKHVSGAPDTRQNLSFSDLRSPSSNPPFPFSIFLKIGKKILAGFFGVEKGTKEAERT